MTLIAAWKEGNTPILIGDLITSRHWQFDATHHALPTRKDLDRLLPREQGLKIADLCQKAYKISDTLAVAWCNYQFSAKSVLGGLFRRYHDSECTVDGVRSFLTSMVGYEALPCTLIGWIMDKGDAQCFKWCSSVPTDFLLGDKFIEGSGSEYFRGIFTPQARVGEDPLEGALGRVAHILKDEVLYGANLWQLFGGGFQVIYWNGDQFTVLPSTTYIFLQVEETKTATELALLTPKRVLKSQYENSLIQILAVLLDEDSFSTHQQTASKLASHEMHYAVPISAELGDQFEVNSNLSFLSDYYCFCIDIKCMARPSNLSDDQFLLLSLIMCVSDEKKDALVEITEEPGSIEGLTIKDGLFRRLSEFLAAARRETASGC